jgi:hypothetical protein
MEATENFPLSWRFYWNISFPGVNWILARCWSKASQLESLGPNKVLLNITFGALDPNTWASVLPLWRTIAYKDGYYSWSVAVPNHLSSQNRISDPSLIKNDPWLKKYFFVAINLAQKCESPGFHRTYDNALDLTYFCLSIVCQIPSSVSNLKSHLPSRAVFLTSRSWIPSPSWSLGVQTTLHLSSL